MVIGDHRHFPYRSSSVITRFFQRCDLNYVHDGSTRKWWTKDVLSTLNGEPSQSPDLPSSALVRVIAELFDPDDFDRKGESRDDALGELNKLLVRDGLEAYFDGSGGCYVRNTGTGVVSAGVAQLPRPLSKPELAARKKVAAFLESASEDEFTEKLLVPLFQRLGFYRVSPAGHKEKTLEFGKDLWMKYQLPTGHWLYFCAQVKRGKIDSGGASGSSNAANILTQVKMALDHPIFDPDAQSQGAARSYVRNRCRARSRARRGPGSWNTLDASQRRHIIFMDRDEFLDQSGRILVDLNLPDDAENFSDDVPF